MFSAIFVFVLVSNRDNLDTEAVHLILFVINVLHIFNVLVSLGQ